MEESPQSEGMPQMEEQLPSDQEPAPTYVEDTWSGLSHYRCLLDRQEFWDMDSLRRHMQWLHQGVMIAGPRTGPEAPPPEAVAAPEEGSGQAPETSASDDEEPPAMPPEEEGEGVPC